jgi:hypothetical protein
MSQESVEAVRAGFEAWNAGPGGAEVVAAALGTRGRQLSGRSG